VTLSNEVECDEVYVVAGHKGQPEVVKNKGRKGRRNRLKGKESCSSIRENQVPQPSTDPNGIILKVLCAVAEAMHQNVVALHTPNRMLDKDADLAQGFIDRLLRSASCCLRVLLTLTRLRIRPNLPPLLRIFCPMSLN
jgi:hypothetical protein